MKKPVENHFVLNEIKKIKNEDGQYFQSLITLYQVLHSEIIANQTQTVSITIGFVVAVLTGLVYAFTGAQPILLVILPPLLGLLFIMAIYSMGSTSRIAFKKAEIELYFQKAGMTIFNWETNFGIEGFSLKLTAIGIGIGYLLPFAWSFYYVLINLCTFQNIEKGLKGYRFPLAEACIWVDFILLAVIIYSIFRLFSQRKDFHNKLKAIKEVKELDNSE